MAFNKSIILVLVGKALLYCGALDDESVYQVL